MKFIPLTSSLNGQWDKIVHSSDDAWMFHLYDWLELEEKVWDLDRKSFLVEHEGVFIGIVPLQMNRRSKRLKSDFMGDSGVALVNGLDPSFRVKTLKEIYQHIEEIALENRSPRVEIYLSPLAESNLKDRWQINPLINFQYIDISTHTFIVDLTQSEGSIMAGLSQHARIIIKKAEKLGYSIRPASGIDKYYEVHCENYHRTGVPPHPKEYFVNIYERICKKGYACVFEALDKSGEPGAFHIVALFKKKAFSWTRCGRTAHLNSGVNYLLQIHSMLWAKSQGAELFEVGEAFPDARDGKEKGLTSFKDKFGGQLHRLFKGRLELGTAPSEAKTFRARVRGGISLLKTIFKSRKKLLC